MNPARLSIQPSPVPVVIIYVQESLLTNVVPPLPAGHLHGENDGDRNSETR